MRMMSLLLLGAALVLPAQVPRATAVVTQAVATMFSRPSFDSDVSSQLLLGEPLEVLEVKPGWARVKGADAYEGWVAAEAFRARSAGEAPYAASGRVVRVEALLANVYREPDVTLHAPVLIAPYGARLEMLGERKDGRWLEVKLPTGVRAWIQWGDVTEDLKPLGLEASLDLAKRFLGVTYTWGGGSALGLDCSGFTQLVVRSRGILMPRDADQQCEWVGVTTVDKEHLRIGDLLFFGSSLQKITHTGMYLGEGRFIHASTHGHPGVQISVLDDAPWKALLVACRRVK